MLLGLEGIWARARRGLACTVHCMSTTTDEAFLSAAQLAALLGVSYKKTKRLCVEQRWYADELPAPIEGVTPRRWRLSDVDAWLMSNERRSWT